MKAPVVNVTIYQPNGQWTASKQLSSKRFHNLRSAIQWLDERGQGYWDLNLTNAVKEDGKLVWRFITPNWLIVHVTKG